jgi:hypothetical protein
MITRLSCRATKHPRDSSRGRQPGGSTAQVRAVPAGPRDDRQPEFALTHASGEYVIFVGSDDGLVMHALPLIDETLRRTNTRALRWESVLYHWPDTGNQEYAPPNRLLIPLTQVNGRYAIHEVDAPGMIRAAANGEQTYARLLLVYCSAVHRDLVELARRRAGRVFGSKTPDAYASFALAYLAGTYHSLTAPLSIAGQSGRATGLGLYAFGGASPGAEEFRRANVEARYSRHPWVPELVTGQPGARPRVAVTTPRATRGGDGDGGSLARD